MEIRGIEFKNQEQCPRYVISRYVVPFPFSPPHSQLTPSYPFLTPLSLVHVIYGRLSLLRSANPRNRLFLLSSNEPTTLVHPAAISFRSSTAPLSGSTIRSHYSLALYARPTRRPNSSGNINSSSSAAEVSVNPPLQSSLFSHMYVPSSSFPSLSLDMC